jgi:hypothetical protein
VALREAGRLYVSGELGSFLGAVKRAMTGSSMTMPVKRRGCMRATFVRAFAPKEWPMAMMGRGMRKVLMTWRMSRA